MQLARKDMLVIGLIALIVCAVGFYAFMRVIEHREVGTEAARALGGDEAKSGRFTDLDGNLISLTEYQGKVRVVNSWASWSPFSADELRSLSTISQEFASEDFVVIAINRAEPNELVKAYLRSIGSPEHILFVQDESDAFYESIDGFSMPETVIYNRDGTISFHKRGHMSQDELRTHANEALQGGD